MLSELPIKLRILKSLLKNCRIKNERVFMLAYLRTKFRIFHIYYFLAGFDIFMLAVTLRINHANVVSFNESININKTFGNPLVPNIGRKFVNIN